MRDYQFSIGKYIDFLKIIPIILVCILVAGMLCWLIPDYAVIIIISSQIAGFFVFTMALIFRYKGRKAISTFQITKEGISIIKHGVIKWNEISMISFENARGFFGVYVKMKNNKRYFIDIVGWKKIFSKAKEMETFFNEIKEVYNTLPEENRFKLDENRIALITNILFTAMLLVVFIGMFLFWYFFE